MKKLIEAWTSGLSYLLGDIVWFKGEWEGERKEVLFAVLYVAIFGILFVIGCFINLKMNIIMTVILLATTAVNIAIREWQSCASFGKSRKDNEIVYVFKMFLKKLIYTLSQALVLGGPFVAFAVCLEQISDLHVALKVIIPITYSLCIPLIAYYEDSSSALNIFELAYDVTWSKRYEEEVKKPLQKKEDENKSD